MSLNNANNANNANGQQCIHSMVWKNVGDIISYACNTCGWVKTGSVKSFTPRFEQHQQIECTDLALADECREDLEKSIAKITEELDMMFDDEWRSTLKEASDYTDKERKDTEEFEQQFEWTELAMAEWQFNLKNVCDYMDKEWKSPSRSD